MYEMIRKNELKTFFLWLLSFLVYYFIVYIFYLFANLLFDVSINSIFIIFLAIWITLSLITYFIGDQLLIKLSKAELAYRNINPKLFNLVDELKIATGLKFVPDIYILPSLSINAFSTGIRHNHITIIVTAGLLSKLNREELQAVIAHEFSHIINRDVFFLSFIAVLSFAISTIILVIVYLAFVFVPLYFFEFDKYILDIFVFIIYSIFIIYCLYKIGFIKPINFFCSFFYLALSKTSEYLADAYAVKLIKNPPGLASALKKIDIEKNKLEVANSITAPMFIESPFTYKNTHPPIRKRIKILEMMSYGANYLDYQDAFNKVVNNNVLFSKKVLEEERITLEENETSLREEETNFVEESLTKTKVELVEELIEEKLDEEVVNYFDCQCGVRVKIPHSYKARKFCCPRCGRIYDSNAESFNSRHFNAINYMKKKSNLAVREVNVLEKDENGKLYYKIKNDEWECLLCQCGTVIQLAPEYSKDHVICKMCQEKIRVLIDNKVDF